MSAKEQAMLKELIEKGLLKPDFADHWKHLTSAERLDTYKQLTTPAEEPAKEPAKEGEAKEAAPKEEAPKE